MKPKYPQANSKGLRLRKLGKSSHSQELLTSPLSNKSSVRKGRTAKSLDNLSLRAIRRVGSSTAATETSGALDNNNEEHQNQPPTRSQESTNKKKSSPPRSASSQQPYGPSHAQQQSDAYAFSVFNLNDDRCSAPLSPTGAGGLPSASYTSSHATSVKRSSGSKDVEEAKSHIPSDSPSLSNPLTTPEFTTGVERIDESHEATKILSKNRLKHRKNEADDSPSPRFRTQPKEEQDDNRLTDTEAEAMDSEITGKSVKQTIFGRLSKKQSGRSGKSKQPNKPKKGLTCSGSGTHSASVLPPEWEPILVSQGITPKEIAENQTVIC